MTNRWFGTGAALGSILFISLMTACGGGSSNSTTGTGNNSGNGGSGSTTANVAQLIVDSGPSSLAAQGEGDEDLAFVTVTVCAPGTSSCTSIDHVQVDTGSSGLRIAPSALTTVSLPPQTVNGNPISECVVFGDNTFIWGPVATADIQIAGEVAKSVPVQILSSSMPPADCGSGDQQIIGVAGTSTQPGLGANGILGVGLFRQDCGGGCAPGTSFNPGLYYSCPGTGCAITTEPVLSQLQNPVWMFPADNNGVILQLPSLPSGQQGTALGTLTFGIGTQSNNGTGNAGVLQADPLTGFFAATFNGVTYNDSNGTGSGHGSSFIDSGSNGYFFLDSKTLVSSGVSLADCSTDPNNSLFGFYCTSPTNPQTVNVSVIGENSSGSGTPVGSARNITFSVADAQTLLQTGNSAFNDVGGPNPASFDFGLPFFFGRSVYFGIENQKTPLGTGPLYAF